MNIPESLLYTKEHEWARVDGTTVTMGITDHAQKQLGDITFVELPEKGAKFKAGESIGVVESVKTVSDIYAPLSGEVVEVNSTVVESPEGLNADPYGDAWLVKFKCSDKAELEGLMSSQDYSQLVTEE